MRQFVPSAAVDDAAGILLAHPDERRYRRLAPDATGFLRIPVAPLLEMKGDSCVHALIAEPANPVRMRWPCSTAAFSSGNNPLQCTDVPRQVDWSQERLAAEKSVPARNIQQRTDSPVSEVLVFYGRSQPDVGRPDISPRRQSPGQVRPFGQQQPIEIERTLDERPQSISEVFQLAAPLEHVRHRGTEHTSAPAGPSRVLIPTERLLPVVVAEPPPWRLRAPDVVACTLCPGLRVAVVACR